jgi:hypothetical protein
MNLRNRGLELLTNIEFCRFSSSHAGITREMNLPLFLQNPFRLTDFFLSGQFPAEPAACTSQLDKMTLVQIPSLLIINNLTNLIINLIT